MNMTFFTSRRIASAVAITSIAISFALAGCKKEDSMSATDTSVAASQDVAESVAGASGSNTGGTADQLTDVSNLAYEAGTGTVAPPEGNPSDIMSDTTIVSGEKIRIFNAADTTWTVVVQRTKTSGYNISSWKRGYKYSYSRNGVKRKYFRTNGLASDKMTFDILSDSCSGTYRTTHLSHKLLSLAGGWSGVISFGTGADSTLMTINSTTTYSRHGIDTLTTRNAVRTSDHTLGLTFVNVVLKRGVGRGTALGYNYGRPISGTINGTFSGTVTFTSGKLYTETTFNRTFTITFGGTDNAAISVTGAGTYNGTFNLQTGELN